MALIGAMPELLIATTNAHKTAEFRAMLDARWKVTDLLEIAGSVSPEETGSTFAENAAIKAIGASWNFDGFVLADDSGLEVDALGGAPGVRSARYAGENASDAENRAKLLQELDSVGARGKARSARFRCALALAKDGALWQNFAGGVEGVIINQEKGDAGFGYDALFVPAGYCETFAQLPKEVKNRESHRARALLKAREFLRGFAE